MSGMKGPLFVFLLFGLISGVHSQYFLYFNEKLGANEGNNCTDLNNPCRSFAVFQSTGGLVDLFVVMDDPTKDPFVTIDLKGTFTSDETLKANLSSQDPIGLNISSYAEPAHLNSEEAGPSNFVWSGFGGSFALNNLVITNMEFDCDSSAFYIGYIVGTEFSARGSTVAVSNSQFHHSALAIVAYNDLQVDSSVFDQPHDDSVSVAGSGVIMLQNPNGGDPPSSLLITGSQFNYNVGYYGGAISVQAQDSKIGLSVFIYQCKFNNNQADEGGAVYILHPNPNITIDTCDFKSNVAQFDFVNDQGGQGGAVYIGRTVVPPTRQTVQITNNSFKNNTAFKNAGAVWMDLFGGDFTGSTFVGNTLPDVNFEDASECTAKDCKQCGGNICTEARGGSVVCFGPNTGDFSYIPCNGTDNVGQFCFIAADLTQSCQCPEGTTGKNCDEPLNPSNKPAPPSGPPHDPGNHPAKPNHTALIVVLTLLGLAVFSGALYGYFYYRSRHNYQAL
eukprot:TRINITY_DN899_c0_g1_i1.p1 TRINITY_DN899_c0_g1~~TRINITY_DN899_c0_g1_i1.p1  ORF type:complete len:503 (+),score=172.33 TRINITY_DN899_c0_g1_i1:169-1677(+)